MADKIVEAAKKMAAEIPPVGTKVTWRINYHTNFGESLWISGSPKALGAWDSAHALPLFYIDGTWEGTVTLPHTKDGRFEYKYMLRYADGNVSYEAGNNRDLHYRPKITRKKEDVEVVEKPGVASLLIEDAWRSVGLSQSLLGSKSAPGDQTNALHSSAFTKVIFRRPAASPKDVPLTIDEKTERLVTLQLRSPRIDAGHVFCVSGNAPSLGDWDERKALLLDDSEFPCWKATFAVPATSSEPLRYKYGIYDTAAKKIATWEDGHDREVPAPGAHLREGQALVRTDEGFRYPVGNWKGAGVAIPVFALRSKASGGVGEFSDLRPLVDWAQTTALKLVQILPVNDTVATHTWTDSYPYAAISVMALHPLYLRMSEMGTLRDKEKAAEFERERQELNALPAIDYERVMKMKSRFYKLLYDQDRDAFLGDAAYQKFFEENKTWLVPYAAFSCLRDRYGTVDYNWWPKHSRYDEREIMKELADRSCASFDDVAVHYFIQWHLHRQLYGAAQYAREKGVVLKGDLPIGIFRYSVDAWTVPHLYNMESQTGAPPDDFSADGQNWGFPTYNWGEMAKDNYAWWRARLAKMANYFDAFRIDHVLGFFRIWEIPYHAINGLLGQFNPAYAMGVDELSQRGLWFDYDRFCKPYIREHMLSTFFGPENTKEAAAEFLKPTGDGMYALKPNFATQRQVEEYVANKVKENPEKAAYYKTVKGGLFGLIGEVLFLEAPGGHAYTPRIALHQTWSYRELPADVKDKLDHIYIHYFYHRQEDLWYQQANKKLPAIKAATDMLVCGEDLGMVPKCVPPVLENLQILSLNVQRMPKDPKMKFFHPADAPYLSVVTPSSHDTSTLRGWWEENRQTSETFYREQLGRHDTAPVYCEPWLVKLMLEQHMHSPAMWAIFPLQDLLGMDGRVRKENPHEERINIPAIAKHYWRYRMHMTLEELIADKEYNNSLKKLIADSGRGAAF